MTRFADKRQNRMKILRLYGRKFTDKTSIIKMIEEYMGYYNNKRLQGNLGVQTPTRKHEMYFRQRKTASGLNPLAEIFYKLST